MVIVEHLSYKYGSRQVLKDISLTAASGDMVAIIGNNGCGKTTLLRVLSGVTHAATGTITYFGQELTGNGHAARTCCGYVPQQNPLLEDLTVRDNLKLWELQKGNAQSVVADMDLNDLLSTPVHRLSGGMKRRLSIACAAENQAPILLLDEPTASLDLHYKSLIWDWMDSYRRRGGIIIAATHDEHEIQMATRRYFMKDGILTELAPSINRDNIFGLINGGI